MNEYDYTNSAGYGQNGNWEKFDDGRMNRKLLNSTPN